MDISPTPQSPSNADLAQLALDLYHKSADGAAVRSSELFKQATRVSHTIFAVAAVQTITAMALFGASDFLKSAPAIRVAALLMGFMAMLFWAMGAWSLRRPLAPAIAALTMHMTTWYAGAAYEYAAMCKRIGVEETDRQWHPDSSSLVKLAIAIALTRAVVAGVKYHKLTVRLRAAEQPIESIPPLLKREERRIAGVATSIGLFFAMLYMKGTITVLSGTGELTPPLYHKMVGVVAIIVMVWSIACWRDVYRPLSKAINPAWYFAAIGIGFITFAIAHGWLALIHHWGLPMINPGDDEFSGDMMMQLLLVCAAPAITEEIAFRGVMFAGFARTLHGWETVLLTALMFMVLHVNPPAYPHLLIMGLTLGAMRLKTGSWLPGVFTHFTHNFLAIAIMHQNIS
jgi:membrane protease YdiL (CAAX protease family)